MPSPGAITRICTVAALTLFGADAATLVIASKDCVPELV